MKDHIRLKYSYFRVEDEKGECSVPINRRCQMSVGLILNLLNELNNIILFNEINKFSNRPARI